jgi:hypothetical protein
MVRRRLPANRRSVLWKPRGDLFGMAAAEGFLEHVREVCAEHGVGRLEDLPASVRTGLEQRYRGLGG